MFSPIGKKKILLQHKFGQGGSRSPSPDASLTRESPPISPSGSQIRGGSITSLTSTGNERPRSRANTAPNLSSLEKLLTDPGGIGQALRKLMEATAHYRPERDGIRLKAFQFSNLDYALFRNNIASTFWITFTDEEFHALTQFYDPQGSGDIDGYAFLKSFTRLGGIRKLRETVELKEKQEAFEARQKEEEELKKLYLDKKNDIRINYNFTAEVREMALRKLETAAKAFDPGHPSAPSTAGFNVNAVRPGVFREMLKLTLNLRVNPAELGAILKEFRPDIGEEIPASDFLKFFYRLGFEARDHDRQLQRKRQEEIEKKAEEEAQRKQEELKKKLKTFVDYNFSEVDETKAMDKLRSASEKYDKTAPGCVSLDGFDCEELSPLDFRELVKRVFNITFIPTELGFVIQKYDLKRSGNVHCKTFLTEFLRLGIEERHKHHLEQLEKQRTMNEQAEKDHVEKMLAVQKSEKVPISQTFTDNDLHTALRKLTDVASFFDKTRGAGLQSFEPQSLNLVQFKRALKRTFDIQFTAPEMGAIVKHLQKNDKGEVLCHPFLTLFIQLGTAERDRLRTEQMAKQRDLDEKALAEEKQRQLDKDSKVLYEVDYECNEDNLNTAIAKMTESARKYDAAHPAAVGLTAFEQKSMTGPEFKEIVRRTFHLVLSPKETGALLGFFHRRSASGRKPLPFDHIDCGEFLKYFLQLGVAERGRLHSEQLEKQKRDNRMQQEEHRRKVEATTNRGGYEPDFNYTDADRVSIDQKILVAAEKFDKNHPAAPSLESFDAAYMTPGIFRENIKAIFGVKATRKEIGYLLSVYGKDKARGSSSSLVPSTATATVPASARASTTAPAIAASAAIAVEEAAGGVAGTGDADATALVPVPTTPVHGGSHAGSLLFSTKDFLIAFCSIGQKARDEKRLQALEEQRLAQKLAQQEEENKLAQLIEKSDFVLDEDYTEEDFRDVVQRLTVVSEKYDKTHPSAPNLDGFTVSSLAPGAFRELMKRAFGIYLNAKEVTALLHRYPHPSQRNMLDGKQFLLFFLRLGFDARARRQTANLQLRRKHTANKAAEAERRLQLSLQRVEFTLPENFTELDRDSAMAKIIKAAAHYDKNAPGAPSLDAFNERSLTPAVFREVLKRAFRVTLTPTETAAMTEEFRYEDIDQIDTSKFLVTFTKLGADERDKWKAMELEKQRTAEHVRRTLEEKAKQEAAAKQALAINYTYSPAQRESAFKLLAAAAKRYDKTHPAAMSLDGFEQKHLAPHVFREMIKRTFGLTPSPEELGALIHFFDQENKGYINSHKFLTHFLKIGITERDKDHRQSLQKLREDAAFRVRFHEEQMAAQWAKAELRVTREFTSEEAASALEQLTVAASKFDPSTSAGSMAVQAFETAQMTPAVFREMLRRCFNLRLSNGELASLLDRYAKKPDVNTLSSGTNNEAGGNGEALVVDCNAFMVAFTQLGSKRRYEIRSEQLSRQRTMTQQAQQAAEEAKVAMDRQADLNLLAKAAEVFSDADFRSALEKVRFLAAHYDRSHPSAPSLAGFTGADMTPSEFQNMLSRTFHTYFSPAEIAALMATFPATHEATTENKTTTDPSSTAGGTMGRKDVQSAKPGKHRRASSAAARAQQAGAVAASQTPQPDTAVLAAQAVVRISNAAFLAYFHRIQRQEAAKRDQKRIEKERLLSMRNEQAHLAAVQQLVEEKKARLLYKVPEDQEHCVEKIKAMAQEFCMDSSPYIDGLQGLKGPALPADKLRSLLHSIFHIKLTLPEMGVLRDTLAGDIATMDPATGESLFDGPRFLKWFFALGRLEEQAMLARLDLQHKLKHQSGKVPPKGGADSSVASQPHESAVKEGDEGASSINEMLELPVGVTLETMRELAQPPALPGKGTNKEDSKAGTARGRSRRRAGTARSLKQHQRQQSAHQKQSSISTRQTSIDSTNSRGQSAKERSRSHSRSRSAHKADLMDDAELVQSVAEFTRSIVLQSSAPWFLALPSGDQHDYTQNNNPRGDHPFVTRHSREDDDEAENGEDSETKQQQQVQQHLSEVFHQRSIADYDPSFIQRRGSPQSNARYTQSVDLGSLLQKKNKTRTGTASSSHVKQRKHGMSTSMSLSTMSTIGNNSMILAPPRTAQKNQIPNANTNGGDKKDTAFLQDVFTRETKPTTGSLHATNESGHGQTNAVVSATGDSEEQRRPMLNPIAELARFKKQQKERQLLPHQHAQPSMHPRAATSSTSVRQLNSSGVFLQPLLLSPQSTSAHASAAQVSGTGPINSASSVHNSVENSRQVSRAGSIANGSVGHGSLGGSIAGSVSGSVATGISTSSKKKPSAISTALPAENPSNKVPAPSPATSFFFFPAAFHSPAPAHDGMEDFPVEKDGHNPLGQKSDRKSSTLSTTGLHRTSAASALTANHDEQGQEETDPTSFLRGILGVTTHSPQKLQ